MEVSVDVDVHNVQMAASRGVGLEMVRYAGDIVVLCRHPQQAERAFELVRSWMERADLTLHPQKTRIVSMEEGGNYLDFLGYRFWKSKKSGKLGRFVRDKSKRNLREGLKPHTRRTSGECLAATVAKINPILQGWYGYFRQARSMALNDVDQWLRGRLRSILRKRRGGEGRGRGSDHHRWPNCYFAELGLFSLVAAQAEETAGLRRGATC